jgi:hypothetical protein
MKVSLLGGAQETVAVFDVAAHVTGHALAADPAAAQVGDLQPGRFQGFEQALFGADPQAPAAAQQFRSKGWPGCAALKASQCTRPGGQPSALACCRTASSNGCGPQV